MLICNNSQRHSKQDTQENPSLPRRRISVRDKLGISRDNNGGGVFLFLPLLALISNHFQETPREIIIRNPPGELKTLIIFRLRKSAMKRCCPTVKSPLHLADIAKYIDTPDLSHT